MFQLGGREVLAADARRSKAVREPSGTTGRTSEPRTVGRMACNSFATLTGLSSAASSLRAVSSLSGVRADSRPLPIPPFFRAAAKPAIVFSLTDSRSISATDARMWIRSRWLLVGDKTALPTTDRLIKEVRPETGLTCLVAIADVDGEQTFATVNDAAIYWVRR